MINQLINNPKSCFCGRTHSFQIQEINISDNAIDKIDEIIASGGYKKPLLVYDVNTYSVCGSYLDMHNYDKLVYSDLELVPDEKAVELLMAKSEDHDLIIGVGSGTINDLCKYCSYKLGIHNYIIATAPSMDGFTSNVAVLIEKGMKVTHIVHTPQAVIADTRVLSTADMNMISAGTGDILGKFTSLCEWKMSELVTGEYFCSEIHDIVNKSVELITSNVSHIKNKTEESLEIIMQGLCISGIAMAYAGNSRPASGSEHHLSHYWEMQFLTLGKKPVLHGIKVGVAAILVLKMYEELLSTNIDFKRAKNMAVNFSWVEWEAKMKELYGGTSDQVIEFERTVNKNSLENVMKRIEFYENNWNAITELIKKLPSSQKLTEILSSLGSPTTPTQIGVDKDMFVNGVYAAKEIRNRFGLLQILFDLGLSKKIAEDVWDK